MDSKIDIWESCVEEDNSETSWNYGCQFKKAGLKIYEMIHRQQK